MQISKKLKMFFQFFTSFLKSTFNFEHFETKDEPHSSWTDNMLRGPKHC